MNRYHTLLMALGTSLVVVLSSGTLLSQHWPSAPIEIRNTANESAESVVDSLVRDIITQINLDTLVHFVKILSGEDSVTINDSTFLFLSRNAIHPHNDLAAEFIFQTLSRYGLAAFNQQYSVTGRNVYAVQTGTDFPDQEYMICAHYDDMPMQPPAPGADDNASGTAAVLEAARVLSQIPTPYTIIYALWDEEEIGLFGSAHYAFQASQAGENIVGVINLDMLGWDGNDYGVNAIITQPIANSVELASLAENLNDDYQIGLAPIIYNPGTERSDHASFWKRGYGAICLSEASPTDIFNPFYHTSDDKIDQFNLAFFHALSKLAAATISHLALSGIPVRVESREAASIAGFVLEQNYPNPFNASTTIEFSLPKSSFVIMKIYNALGEEVVTLIEEQRSAGIHKFNWNAMGLASGVYLYRLEAGEFIQSKKLILLR
jgi:hypothetical protein